jgi:hypothetical protein
LRECFADERQLLDALPKTPGREEDSVSAVEAFRHDGSATSLLASVKPYVDELRPRIAYVEKELAENGGLYLCGGDEASYADLFVLPIVLLCLKYTAQAAGTEAASVLSSFPSTARWVDALQQRGGPHGLCAKLMAEMVCLHGRPSIEQVSQKYGYDYELVGKGHSALVYDPFIRDEALQVLRTHYESRPGDIFVATYPKVKYNEGVVEARAPQNLPI